MDADAPANAPRFEMGGIRAALGWHWHAANCCCVLRETVAKGNPGLDRNRLSVMKRHLLLTAFVAAPLVLSAGISGPAAPKERPPNVLFIMADDLGAADLGSYGAKDIETPNLDALAERGVRFTQFYSGAPVCSPSRACMLTGRYPLRCGVTGNAASQRGGKEGLPASEVTTAETLRPAGYVTGLVGKWHLGYTPDMSPNAQGFDYQFGHMGGCIDNYSHFFFWSGPNIHDLHRNGQEIYENGRFFPDLTAGESLRFIEKHRDRPWYLYYATNLPHYPYQPEPKWLEHYRNLPQPRRLYAAWVSTMDERVGLVLRRVERSDLRDRTIVVFQSDNGHSTEDRAFSGGGSAGPYRGAKFSMFEGGIRMPAIVSWPGHLPAGVLRGQVAHAADWLPTLAELTHAPILNPDLDGRSLVPVLRSETAATPNPVLHWHLPGRPDQWAVREGEWKLLGNPRDTTQNERAAPLTDLFLVNLASDPGERHNLAAAHPEIVARLKGLHDDWLRHSIRPEALAHARSIDACNPAVDPD